MAATRRAISPVIATVILIAVSVALAIAVAVWAGALTASLDRPEKVIVLFTSVTGNAPALIVQLSITNQSPNPVTVTQIFFNGILVSPADITGNPATIPSGSTATVSLHNLPGQSGISYPLTVWLASGSAYPATVNWP